MYPFWHQRVLDQSLHLSRERINTSTVFISQSCRMNGCESATTHIMAVLDPGLALLGLLYPQADSLPLVPPATSQANSLSSLNSAMMSEVFCLVLLSSLFLCVVDKVVILTNPSHLSHHKPVVCAGLAWCFKAYQENARRVMTIIGLDNAGLIQSAPTPSWPRDWIKMVQ